MTRHTTHQDGSISYPKRGKPPPEPYGYTRDPKDAFRFLPDFEPCIHRKKQVTILPCGKINCDWSCDIVPGIVNVSVCSSCDKIEQ